MNSERGSMAAIRRRKSGFEISVSKGYDINGKQLREYMTWVPSEGMTPKQIEKELNRQATLFEEKVTCSTTHSGNTRLKEFSDKFMAEYVNPNLKPRTAFGYAEKLKIINEALGHIKLKDLKPGHIASFYANLQEAGMRAKELAVMKVVFSDWLEKQSLTMAALAENVGVSLGVIKRLKAQRSISKASALKIAAYVQANPGDLFTFRRNMTPLTPGTIHTYHRILSAVLSKAEKWGYIASNPAARVDLPSLKRSASYLDEADSRRLLEYLRDEPIKWRALMAFDLLSGLRRGELLGLRWRDVNFDDQTIAVVQTSNYLPGKGVYVDTPKTDKSSRPIRLSSGAFALLNEYKKWQDAQRAALGDAWEDKDGRVFTSDSGAPIFPGSITKWFGSFIEKTGLPKVTVHSLRHTYASLMIADGAPLVIVSHQLGHAQVSTTANIYAHVIASAEAKAAQTFDKFNDIII